MTIRKLPSGSYRIEMMEKGRRYSVVVPFKPKDDIHAYNLIREKIDHPHSKYDGLRMSDAIDKYIEIKSNVVSPATTRGYSSIKKNLSPRFLKLALEDIDHAEVQKEINDYTKGHSPKSVRNAHGLISAVIGTFKPEMVLTTTLPAKTRSEPYIPTSEDVQMLMQYTKENNPPFYVGLSLACLSLRRSEICALTLDDLSDDNIITINKALVPDKDNNYVVKNTAKTDASNRSIQIPDSLADIIREQGYIYKYNPNAMDKYLRTTLPKLGIQTFSVHKLRHFFASYAHELGTYTDQQIAEIGGWSGSGYIMKQVYRHAMNKDTAKKNLANDIGMLF